MFNSFLIKKSLVLMTNIKKLKRFRAAPTALYLALYLRMWRAKMQK